LGSSEYEIRLFGDLVARGQLRIDKLLASGDGRTTGTLTGEATSSSIGGGEAVWIDPASREQAMIYGYKTRTAPSVLADHLEQVARTHANELLSHDATKHLLDELRHVAPALVDELVPRRLTVADVQQVLQGLLRESLPIRQLGIILETLGEAAEDGSQTESQIERVRQRLSRTLCSGLRDGQRVLRVITLDRAATDAITRVPAAAPLAGEGRGSGDKSQDFTCDAIRQAVKKLTGEGYPPVVLVGPEIRRRVKQFTEAAEIWTHVLSTAEITHDTQLQIHSVVPSRPNAVAA
jgi:flagellar biosynthesis protein FlhA